jgi:hypothetical protein
MSAWERGRSRRRSRVPSRTLRRGRSRPRSRGPIPGTLISRVQSASWRATASISPDRPSTRSSSRRQSPAMSSMSRTMRGDRTSGGVARMRGNSARKNRCPCRTATPRSSRKGIVDQKTMLDQIGIKGVRAGNSHIKHLQSTPEAPRFRPTHLVRLWMI